MKHCLYTACAVALLPLMANAEIRVTDAYARASNTMAGAAFMVIENTGLSDDRLIAVQTDAAARAELHTHSETADGIMKMQHLSDGLVIPAGKSHVLQRGGDHVMLMGLTTPLVDGANVALTLSFEQAGDIQIDMPVDLSR